MIRRLVAVLTAVLVAILTPASIFASWTSQVRTSTPIYVDYDNTGTSLVYCKIGPELPGPGALTAAGSTTTTILPAGSYSVVQDEDIIYVRDTRGVVTANAIKTYSSTSSVVVASSWTLASATWSYRSYKSVAGVSGCGTAATDGWIDLPAGTHTITLIVDTLGATSVDYSIEAKAGGVGRGGDIVVLASGTGSISAVGTVTYSVPGVYAFIRVGLKRTGAGANRTNVTLNSQS